MAQPHRATLLFAPSSALRLGTPVSVQHGLPVPIPEILGHKTQHKLLMNDDGDYLTSYMHGDTRKVLRVYVNFLRLHERYYDDSNYRLVLTAASAIDSLEKVKLEDLGEVTKRENACICFEGLNTKKLAMKLPCQHLFHDRCIAKWLQSSHFCPLCRFEMLLDV